MMLVIFVVSILGVVRASSWTSPVDTTSGRVRGVVEQDLTAFRGIPYAILDDENPFGLSSPHPYMEGVFDAVDDSSVCPQREEYNLTIVGSLDCLHLNVYMPHNTTADSKLPVLAYIFGGGFSLGYSRGNVYGPKYLVRHDIIMVIFNYRLGPYGFMCLDTEEIPGNQGLKDQVLALRWIKNNIAAFGGDDENITIMGNSAGGMSADLHILSQVPKVFNKVVLQSGTAMVPSTVAPSDPTAPFKLAEHLGLKTDNLKEAISFLTNTHTDLVVAAVLELGHSFLPCVEKEFNNVERFIHIHPLYNNLSTAENIKILGGFNSHEVLGMVIESPDSLNDLLFPATLTVYFDIRDMSDMIRKLRRFYIGDDIITEEVRITVTDFLSDYTFIYPVQKSLDKYVNKGLEVFQYLFSFNGNRNYVISRISELAEGYAEKGLVGAAHADELGYLFDMVFFPDTPTGEDQITMDRMTTMWTNFMKYGDPTPSLSELVPVIWPPATSAATWALDINSTLTVLRRPYHARMSFWDLFFAANEDKLLDQDTSSSYRLTSSYFIMLSLSVTIYLLQF